jgi:hypothetical protein
MIKSLFYKEWLKIRWTFLALGGISFIAIFYIFLDVAHGIELNGAVNYWAYLIYKKYPFGYDLLYIPFIIGVVLGIAQYYPEINSGRLKLTLHLPIKENKILITMVLLTGGLLLVLFLINLLLFTLLSGFHFPKEITFFNLLIIIPFYIAGLLSYFATATIMVEPVWSRRIPQLIFFLGLISILFGGGEFTTILILFFLILCCFSLMTILLSGFYYKRGIK